MGVAGNAQDLPRVVTMDDAVAEDSLKALNSIVEIDTVRVKVAGDLAQVERALRRRRQQKKA